MNRTNYIYIAVGAAMLALTASFEVSNYASFGSDSAAKNAYIGMGLVLLVFIALMGNIRARLLADGKQLAADAVVVLWLVLAIVHVWGVYGWHATHIDARAHIAAVSDESSKAAKAHLDRMQDKAASIAVYASAGRQAIAQLPAAQQALDEALTALVPFATWSGNECQPKAAPGGGTYKSKAAALCPAVKSAQERLDSLRIAIDKQAGYAGTVEELTRAEAAYKATLADGMSAVHPMFAWLGDYGKAAQHGFFTFLSLVCVVGASLCFSVVKWQKPQTATQYRQPAFVPTAQPAAIAAHRQPGFVPVDSQNSQNKADCIKSMLAEKIETGGIDKAKFVKAGTAERRRLMRSAGITGSNAKLDAASFELVPFYKENQI